MFETPGSERKLIKVNVEYFKIKVPITKEIITKQFFVDDKFTSHFQGVECDNGEQRITNTLQNL